MNSAKVPVGIAAALALTTLFALVSAPSAAADDPFLGTWVLNVAKSKYTPGPPPKEQTVTYEAAGDQVKITVKGVAADGTPISLSNTAKYDGKDYPATGNAAWDMQSFKRVDANTLDITRKKDGKVVQTATNVVSQDGKTRTITVTGVDETGQKIDNVSVYDKK